MRHGGATRIAGMQLVGGGAAVDHPHMHEGIATLNTDGVGRASRIAGDLHELHPEVGALDPRHLAASEREPLVQRNGRTDWTLFVTGCCSKETENQDERAHAAPESRSRTSRFPPPPLATAGQAASALGYGGTSRLRPWLRRDKPRPPSAAAGRLPPRA